jgi:hypothetical protein
MQGKIMTRNRYFENVAEFKYLRTTATNQKFDSGRNKEEIELG